VGCSTSRVVDDVIPVRKPCKTRKIDEHEQRYEESAGSLWQHLRSRQDEGTRERNGCGNEKRRIAHVAERGIGGPHEVERIRMAESDRPQSREREDEHTADRRNERTHTDILANDVRSPESGQQRERKRHFVRMPPRNAKEIVGRDEVGQLRESQRSTEVVSIRGEIRGGATSVR
jgi:hypothetical protein